MTSTEKHLEGITVDKLMEFMCDQFVTYASSCSDKGTVKLGYNLFGKFVVKQGEYEGAFSNPAVAIEKYAELITEQ